MSTCKTCRHWGEAIFVKGIPDPPIGVCGHPKQQAPSNLRRDTMALIQASGPDYGCIHHEHRETER